MEQLVEHYKELTKDKVQEPKEVRDIEVEVLKLHLEEHPYPNYDVMKDKLRRSDTLTQCYDTFTHDMIKQIYENPMNPIKIIQCMNALREKSNDQIAENAMVILSYYTPYVYGRIPFVKNMPFKITALVRSKTPGWIS